MNGKSYIIFFCSIHIFCAALSKSPIELNALQGQFDELMKQRNEFFEKHDREKRLSALKKLYPKVQACKQHPEITQTKECKAFLREFEILTILYFKSLNEAERTKLRSFSKQHASLLQEASQQKIQLKRQEAFFDLFFI